MELDLRKLFLVIFTHAKLIIASVILGAFSFYMVSAYFLTPVYTSTTQLHVSNVVSDETTVLTSSDVSVSRALLKTFIVILNSNISLEKIADEANLGYSAGQIRGMISAEQVASTEVFKVSVSHTNPNEAQIIASAIEKIAPEEFRRVLSSGSVSVVDHASLPSIPSSPNVMKNTVIGALLAFVLVVFSILYIETLDTRVRDELVLEQEFSLPVIGLVPSFSLVGASPNTSSKKKSKKKSKKEGK